MRFKGRCTVLVLTAVLAVLPLWPIDTAAYAQENAKKVVLTLGSKDALLNDTPYQLEIPPVLVEGTTFLPVRFLAEEILGAVVNWDASTKTIQLSKNEVNIKFSLETGQASVNGQEVEISNPPFIKDGRTLAPLRFLAENLNMQIQFNPTEKTITITEVKLEPANLPPVITSLGLQGDVIKIGEVPVLNYTYDNEEGEGIIAEEWSYRFAGDTRVITGKPRAFFRPGEYLLFLRIKDTAGNWSETATTSFFVSEEKLMGEIAFKFSKPVYGEIFENVENVNFNILASNENVTFERTGPVLHFSNSPEEVTQPGILYRSEASGNFRLKYHHLNGSTEKQYLYVIAENNGLNPVTLKTIKSGVGGPVNDYMSLGQLVAMRYLSSQPSNPVTIQPGEKIILNPDLRFLKHKEAVTGMQDFEVDGTITISVVMGPEKVPEGETGVSSESVPVKTPEEMLKEKIEYLLSLPALPRDSQHIRGVFPGGDCLVDIQVNDERMEKVILGRDLPGFDAWIEGFDPLTGDTIKNVGNYGVVYRLKLSSPVKTGMLLNPRGSIFRGAFLAPDGKVYEAPENSFFTGSQRAAVLGVLEAGKMAEFVYTPPSGSDTPVVIALIPEEFWD